MPPCEFSMKPPPKMDLSPDIPVVFLEAPLVQKSVQTCLGRRALQKRDYSPKRIQVSLARFPEQEAHQ